MSALPNSIAATTGSTRVSLRFTASAPLPGGDDRPTGGKLELLEVLPALPTHTFDYGSYGTVRLAATGIDQDGWMARTATLALPASAGAQDLALRLEYPNPSGSPTDTIQAQLSDSAAPTTQTLRRGEISTLHVPVPASAIARTLRLELPADFPLPAPDTRRRAARLLQVDLTPVPKLPEL